MLSQTQCKRRLPFWLVELMGPDTDLGNGEQKDGEKDAAAKEEEQEDEEEPMVAQEEMFVFGYDLGNGMAHRVPCQCKKKKRTSSRNGCSLMQQHRITISWSRSVLMG